MKKHEEEDNEKRAQVHYHDTRCQSDIAGPRCRLAKVHSSFVALTVAMFSALPMSLRNLAIIRVLIPLSYTFIIGFIRSRIIRYIFWFCLVQVNIVSLQFSLILSFLTSQFNVINKILNENNCLQMLMIYNRLIKACLILNDLYSHQLLLVMFHLVISLIDNITTTMRHITDTIFNDIPIDFAIFFLFISYDFYCLLQFRAIVDNCSALSMEANSFNKRLFKILLETNREYLLKDELLQTQLLRNKKVEFTACGMFTLDYSTFHSALATCFTYLILMVQLSDRGDS
ncbi:hypothetical protein O3M35_010264 [Rhynocoris fuscipes]|uniref:Gustatory receptor n=1 Tax=Rhynocoris fuscipes TaxID=488301 RepID=A0AAW1CZR0_9HEMI